MKLEYTTHFETPAPYTKTKKPFTVTGYDDLKLYIKYVVLRPPNMDKSSPEMEDVKDNL